FRLIHPELQNPQLAEFFADRSHVQRIDFAKICRTAFLPASIFNSDVDKPTRTRIAQFTSRRSRARVADLYPCRKAKRREQQGLGRNKTCSDRRQLKYE